MGGDVPGRREVEQVVSVSDFAVPLLETTMVVVRWCCCHVLDAINIVLPQLVLDIFHMASTFISSISTSASTFNDLNEEEPYVTMLEGKTLEDYIPRNHDHHFREQLEEGIFYAFEIFMVALRGCQEHVKQQATHTGLNSLNAQRYRERQGDIECT